MSCSTWKRNFDEGRPEINIVIDRIRAGVYNIGIESLTSQLENLLMGAEAGQWDTEGELKDITIKLPRIAVNQLDEIKINNGDDNISLYSIADIHTSRSPKEIYRHNQVRIGKVTAQINADTPLDHIVRKITVAMSEIDFPPNYRFQITGEEQKRRRGIWQPAIRIDSFAGSCLHGAGIAVRIAGSSVYHNSFHSPGYCRGGGYLFCAGQNL